MSSTALPKVPPGSVDTVGLSVATSSRSADQPRQGTVYVGNFTDAVPVWFHPLNTRHYMMLMSQYRTGTSSKVQPYVLTTTPSWVIVEPSTGAQNRFSAIPTRLASGDRTLTAAVSRGDYLFVLSQSDGKALLQHFRSTALGAMQLLGEEWVPGDLSLGLFIEKNDLWVYGAHASNQLTVARRNWGRIGTPTNRDPQMNWLFRTARGWSSEVSEMEPIDGGGLPCDGPVSIAARGNKYYLLATSHRDTVLPDSWTSKAYLSRYPDTGWEALPDHDIDLGKTTDAYVGPARLQPQIPVSPGYTMVTTASNATVLRPDSTPVQAFAGDAEQDVTLPGQLTSLTPFTIYNHSTANITAKTSLGSKITIVKPGKAITFTPGGRHKLFTFAGTATPDLTMFQALMGTKVDKTIWEWVPVIYPHWFPVQASVAKGVQNCIAAINAWPGKFGLSGYSQGAILCSGVLWELRYGSMQHRYQDLIGAVMFGNPLREAGVTIPNGIDPGGAGMGPDDGTAAGRIRDTPNDIWWEFANNNYEDKINGLHKIPGSIAGDPFGVTPTTPAGEWITAVYQFMLGEFTGNEDDIIPHLKALFSNQAPAELKKIVQALLHMIKGFGIGHMEYASSKPLPGSDLTSVELGVKHLNELGRAAPLSPQITGTELALPSTWSQSTPATAAPATVNGFPYVISTTDPGVKKADDAVSSWVTSWNVFTV